MRRTPILASVLIAVVLLASGCGKKEEPPYTLGDEFPYCPAGLDKSISPPDALRVETYRLTVSAEGIEPVEFTLPGNVISANLDKIPKGENRTVLVEAINNRGQVICRRELTGVTIKGGTVIPIAMSLLAVPFIANISDGNLITQTRLTFQGYGEPAGAVEITDEFAGVETVLTDLNTNNELVSPSINDAGFAFKPAVLAVGEHIFHVRDIQTGQASQVTVTLVIPGRFPGTGISVAGSIGAAKVQTIGRNDLFSEALEALMK